MKPQNKVVAASGLVLVALYAGADYLVERVGYVSSIALLLPQSWLRSMRTEPYLLIGCAVLLAIAIGLLWSVAWNTARAIKAYNASNQKAWGFDAEFRALRDAYQAIHDQYAEIIDLLKANNAKLDRLESERERTQRAITTANAAAVSEAIETLSKVAADRVEEVKSIAAQFDAFAEQGRERVAGLTDVLSKKNEHLLEQHAARLSEENRGWREEIATEFRAYLDRIREAAGLTLKDEKKKR